MTSAERLVHSWVRRQVERLAALGVLTVRDVEYEPDESEFTETEGGLAELTPAGVPVAVRFAEDLGITVLAQPDPATATAADIVEPLEEWQADAAAWVQRRDGGEAADDLIAAFGGGDPAEQVALLEELWRVERPGTGPILETIGAHHPDRGVAKTARKCLLRYRSRAANNR